MVAIKYFLYLVIQQFKLLIINHLPKAMLNSENPVAPDAAPLKKTWANPELTLISSNEIISPTKIYPKLHEGTAKYVTGPNTKSLFNQAGTYHILITNGGLPFQNKSSAFS